MKGILRALFCAGLLVSFASIASADEQTWSGQISDSTCGPSHAKVLVTRPKSDQTPEACVLFCIKGGAKYVFVSGGKVYNIANQNFKLLPVQAGHSVELSGEMNGDTVTITRLTVPPKVIRIPATKG